MDEEILIRFRLFGSEAQALRQWSAEELRRPRDQVRHVLLTELLRRGLLSSDARQPVANRQEVRNDAQA